MKPSGIEETHNFFSLMLTEASKHSSLQFLSSINQYNVGSSSILHRVTLPDGKVKEGKKWVTSPMDIAKEISKSLAANALISQVSVIPNNPKSKFTCNTFVSC